MRGVGAARLLSAGRVRLILIDLLSARPRGPFRAANLRRPAGRHSNHIAHLFRQRRGSVPSRAPGDHLSVGSRPFDAFLSAARFYPRRPHASAGSPDSVLPLFFAPTMLRLADNVLGLRTGPHHSVPRYCSLRLYKSCPQAPTAHGRLGRRPPSGGRSRSPVVIRWPIPPSPLALQSIPPTAARSGPPSPRRPQGRHSGHLVTFYPSEPLLRIFSPSRRPSSRRLTPLRCVPRRGPVPHSPDQVERRFLDNSSVVVCRSHLRLAYNVLGLRTGPAQTVSRLRSLRGYTSVSRPRSALGPVGTEAAARRLEPESGC